LEEVMPESPPLEIFRERYVAWLLQQGRAMKLGEEFLRIYGEASPAQISADGLYRYWQKVRLVA
jgi:hypothetical protein